jgi:hypothetical protein
MNLRTWKGALTNIFFCWETARQRCLRISLPFWFRALLQAFRCSSSLESCHSHRTCYVSAQACLQSVSNPETALGEGLCQGVDVSMASRRMWISFAVRLSKAPGVLMAMSDCCRRCQMHQRIINHQLSQSSSSSIIVINAISTTINHRNHQ